MSCKFLTVPSSVARALRATTCWCRGIMLVICEDAVVPGKKTRRCSQLEFRGCADVVPGRLGTAAEWLGVRRRGAVCFSSSAASGEDEKELYKGCSPTCACPGGWLGSMWLWARGRGVDGLLFCSSPASLLLQCAEALLKTAWESAMPGSTRSNPGRIACWSPNQSLRMFWWKKSSMVSAVK